jgi:hypothetical protein
MKQSKSIISDFFQFKHCLPDRPWNKAFFSHAAPHPTLSTAAIPSFLVFFHSRENREEAWVVVRATRQWWVHCWFFCCHRETRGAERSSRASRSKRHGTSPSRQSCGLHGRHRRKLAMFVQPESSKTCHFTSYDERALWNSAQDRDLFLLVCALAGVSVLRFGVEKQALLMYSSAPSADDVWVYLIQ